MLLLEFSEITGTVSVAVSTSTRTSSKNNCKKNNCKATNDKVKVKLLKF